MIINFDDYSITLCEILHYADDLFFKLFLRIFITPIKATGCKTLIKIMQLFYNYLLC